jgi:hypothetical protein
MKVVIERIRYIWLWNNEFLQVVTYIIGICSKYDNEKLHLGKSYEELVSFRPILDAMTVSVRKNEKIANMGQLDTERYSLMKGVNEIVETFDELEIPEIHKHSGILMGLFEKHQTKTIPLATRASESERLQKLETEVNSSPEIQSAFEALGLQPVIKRLFAANKEYSNLFYEYISEKSAEEHIDIADLRKKCTKALTQYYDAVQYCAFAHEENDYQPLVNELKKLSTYYNQQLKARATRRKNGKKISEEEPIELPKTTETDKPAEDISTTTTENKPVESKTTENNKSETK